jgi:cold shock protein
MMRAAQEPLGTHRRGACTVKWWHVTKGYGALSCPDITPLDVWCHFSVIEGEGFRQLTPGQAVEVEYYRFDQNSFKYVASRVRRLANTTLAGGSDSQETA